MTVKKADTLRSNTYSFMSVPDVIHRMRQLDVAIFGSLF
jgi:hypothetical protein